MDLSLGVPQSRPEIGTMTMSPEVGALDILVFKEKCPARTPFLALSFCNFS